ncbi:MAG: hypothetical protein K6A45_05670 [Lachnospiraceae bacterium]|nr:hypothetical protein [Lachnospiraceae bacterium]
MSKLNDEELKQSYQGIMGNMVASEEEKNRVIEICSKENGKGAPKHIGWHISKGAAAVLAVVCGLVLSGGIVWARNRFLINDAFSLNSEVGVEEILQNDDNNVDSIPIENSKVNEERYVYSGEEFTIGDYKVICEGAGYDSALLRGYLFFSFWDKDGNPVDQEQLISTSRSHMGDMTLTRKTMSHFIPLGDDEVNFTFYESGGMHTIRSGNCLCFTYERLSSKGSDPAQDYGDIKFLVLDKKATEQIENELQGLLDTELLSVTWDTEKDRPVRNYDLMAIQPEVIEILDKYNPRRIKNIDAAPQIIELPTLKVTVGRLDVRLDYNVNDLDIDSFILRRDDGTEIKFTYDAERWKVEGDMYYLTGSFTIGEDREEVYSLGFVLGKDEKVTIEVDGETY